MSCKRTNQTRSAPSVKGRRLHKHHRQLFQTLKSRYQMSIRNFVLKRSTKRLVQYREPPAFQLPIAAQSSLPRNTWSNTA
jgi:hypothetical protein